MTNDIIITIEKYIDKCIETGMRKKYLGDTWNRILAAGYGVNYDSDYVRNEYKKERGQSIFEYYRERVYKEILEQIEKPEEKREEIKKETEENKNL